jgi:hypothetical protein
MILDASLVVAGAALMILGVWMLLRWMGDEGEGTGKFGFGSRGASQNDWVLMDLQFIALVIAPLLGGAILLVFGLARLD